VIVIPDVRIVVTVEGGVVTEVEAYGPEGCELDFTYSVNDCDNQEEDEQCD